MSLKLYIYDVMTDEARDIPAIFLRMLFRLCSWVYGGIIRCLRFMYGAGILRAHKLDKPVISVGNITVGGVGKTPLVAYLVKYFKAKNMNPVVLIRGYMEKGVHYASTQDGPSDEAEELRENFPDVPVMVGPNRVRSTKHVPEDYPVDVYILDDGYQHWKLKRTLDVLAVDGLNPFGNRHMIPRGILREPLNGISRADVCVITKADWGQDNIPVIEQELRKYNPGAIVAKVIHAPEYLRDVRTGNKVPLEHLKGKRVASFCSIGSPESFKKTLTALSYQLCRNFPFVDHHRYVRRDFDQIVAYCSNNDVDYVVTTEKDSVKVIDFISQFPETVQVLSLKVKISFVANEKDVQTKLDQVCRI